MIYKSHHIEIYVNGTPLELESQDSLNLRFNNVLCNPEKISTTQAEYSFEFSVPSTPTNDKVFVYSNNLAQLNKFHTRYDADVYADGTLIFTGTLTLNSVKGKKYNCNLVSVKVYSLEDIFGEMTMNKIKWDIPFEGASSEGVSDTYTINWYNYQQNPEVTFPLVSYGAFQKSPYNSDEVANDYTSKFDLDKWNRWYIESFYPSANVLTTVKKAFETKGYTVGGDAFHNPYLTKIYASGNLADEQAPIYNIGNPKFGQVDLTTTFTTEGSGYEQELKFPYFKVHTLQPAEGQQGVTSTTEYNWTNVFMYDILDSGVTVNQDVCYMYQPNEHVIVVPADGFYKIELYAETTLNTSGTITAKQYWVNPTTSRMHEEDVEMNVGLTECTPIEIALVKNYDDNYELIKGKRNKVYTYGSPYYQSAVAQTKEWLTCFPHENLYNADNPTKTNDLNPVNTTSRFKGERTSTESSGGSFGGRRSPSTETRGGTTNHGDPTGQSRKYTETSLGYVYKDGEIMAYDQAVSESFVCGFSSFLGGTSSVMKNGYSWSKISSTLNEAFYPEVGYDFLKIESGTTGDIVATETDHNYNTYINTPIIANCNVSSTAMNGRLSCIVRLNKNDRLQLMAIQRGWYNEDNNPVLYSTTNNVRLKISAFSPRDYYILKAENAARYEAPTEFPVNLNVANFFNEETLVSEWIQNVADAFNLSITQTGSTVELNVRKDSTTNYAVNIDDRCNSNEAEAERIDYPATMAVKYKINEDEWGFERSAVAAANGNESVLNNDDWKELADYGYDEIKLNDDSYVTTKSEKSLQFSYTWYDNFNFYNVNSAGTQTTQDAVVIRMPVVSNFSYMIDGYDYEESMKHDGFGLPQRFWFQPVGVAYEQYMARVWTETYPRQYVFLYVPKNQYKGLNLSYKTQERSLLEFFNIKAFLASNYVSVDVYLTPEEYKLIKDGAMVKFDDDLYYPVELEGYDPVSENPTNLKMIKKIV